MIGFGALFRRLFKREPELFCGVCRRNPAAGVFSSRFGPVSHACCGQCADEGAEPLYMLCFHIHRAGGPEEAGELMAGARTFHDGRYIGFAEIVGLYPEFSDEFDDEGGGQQTD